MFHIIIDGYNFLHASRGSDHDWTGMELQVARESILGFLATRRRPGKERVTVVFDGGAGGAHGPRRGRHRGVEVLFSEPGETADEVICRIVTTAPNPRSYLVVSADRQIREAVLAVGAKVVGPRNFLVTSETHHERRERQGEGEPPEKYRGTGAGEVGKWREIFGFDEEDGG